MEAWGAARGGTRYKWLSIQELPDDPLWTQGLGTGLFPADWAKSEFGYHKNRIQIHSLVCSSMQYQHLMNIDANGSRRGRGVNQENPFHPDGVKEPLPSLIGDGATAKGGWFKAQDITRHSNSPDHIQAMMAEFPDDVKANAKVFMSDKGKQKILSEIDRTQTMARTHQAPTQTPANQARRTSSATRSNSESRMTDRIPKPGSIQQPRECHRGKIP